MSTIKVDAQDQAAGLRRLFNARGAQVVALTAAAVVQNRAQLLAGAAATLAGAGRSVLVLDMEYWGCAYLRPFQQVELSKTGDSEKRQLLVEYALVAKQQASSGVVADLTTP